jgi:hypothetical protein
MVERSAVARALVRQKAKEQQINLAYSLPDEIQKLGRFAEPALARIYAVTTDPAIQQEAAHLLDELNASKLAPSGL